MDVTPSEESIVYRPDPQRLASVLAGVAFPAAKWELVMHAEHYGADVRTRADLWALPAGSYADLPDVFAAMGLAPARARHRYHQQPAAQAAAREQTS